MVNYLQRRGIRRGVGTFMVMGGLILAAAAFFSVFGALLADQLSQLDQQPAAGARRRSSTGPNTRFGTQLDPNQILNNFGLGAKDIANIAQNLGVGLLSVLGTAVNWVFSRVHDHAVLVLLRRRRPAASAARWPRGCRRTGSGRS